MDSAARLDAPEGGGRAALENDIRELRGAEPTELARRLVERGWTRSEDVEELCQKAAQIGFTYGALGRDFEYVWRNVKDMLDDR